jgi:hypothetical protein
MFYQPKMTDVDEWAKELEQLHARIASRFARAEPRQRALAYLRGLLSSVERKNGWQLAEEAGEATPDGMQRLLSTAHWNADTVRDDLIAYVQDHLADPEAILIIDETGFLKKGKKSAGVKNQYSGTAGGIGKLSGGRLSRLLDEPRTCACGSRIVSAGSEWIENRARRSVAHIPDEMGFVRHPATSTPDAQATEERSTSGQMGDRGHSLRRMWLPSPLVTRTSALAYVLALACNDGVDIVSQGVVYPHFPIKDLAPDLFTEWHRESAGSGAKGERWFDWALIPAFPFRHCWMGTLVAGSPSYPGQNRMVL